MYSPDANCARCTAPIVTAESSYSSDGLVCSPCAARDIAADEAQMHAADNYHGGGGMSGWQVFRLILIGIKLLIILGYALSR